MVGLLFTNDGFISCRLSIYYLGFFQIKSWNVQEPRTDYRPICRIRSLSTCVFVWVCSVFVCFAYVFFSSSSFVQAQLTHMSDVGAHMCSGSCLFAYSALIMFYGKLLLVCGCFYSMAHLVGYNTSEGISTQSTNTTSTIQLRHTHTISKQLVKERKLNTKIEWEEKVGENKNSSSK